MSEKVIRNISPEEFERMAKGDGNKVTAKKKQVENKSSVIDADFSEDTDDKKDKYKLYQHLLKGFEEFEPKPYPFKLVSGNKIIPAEKLTENNEIFVRRMSYTEKNEFLTLMAKTVQHGETIEGIESFFKNSFNFIIKSCVKSNIDYEQLSEIDKIPLFLFIIGLTYGEYFPISKSTKREMGLSEDERIEVSLLNGLNIAYVPDSFEYPFRFKLSYPDTNITMTMHYPRIKDEALLFSKGNGLTFIKNLVIKISGTKKNGNDVAKNDTDNIITYLPDEDIEAIRFKMKEFSEFGMGKTTRDFVCDNPDIVPDSVPIDLGDFVEHLMIKIKEENDI